ncbi:universal stress protein [Aquimarina algicola]|uniref:Universal stress protein n=1 Tax=Aquimarina algicola TaxID=2589995 RepID=A0A504JJZ3_9FLAO|nr:universal stress protein [Aquimarina algicola]TPN87069.1 universal stress protein [Aquimarina algicola]
MKRILVPIDFSTNALNALEYARELFNNEECIFFLLNVYVSNRSAMLSEEYNDTILDKMSDESEHELEVLLKKLIKNNNYSNHEFKAISVTDTLLKAINHVSISKKINYIVMGTKGAKGAKEIFLGSNTVKVINGINKCPIIVVPQNYIPKPPSLIAFSTNFKRTFYQNELEPLIEIVLSKGSKINIARIMDEEYLTNRQNINKETLKGLFHNLDYIFCKIDVGNSEAEALRNFTMQTESDLIVLIHHKQNFFQKLLEEDVVDKISFNSVLPILILPELK